MTEKQKQELIEMGFSDRNNYMSITMSNGGRNTISLEIDKHGNIKLDNWDVGMVIGKFESTIQIRRKMEGLKMLVS